MTILEDCCTIIHTIEERELVCVPEGILTNSSRQAANHADYSTARTMELAERISHAVPTDGSVEPLPRFGTSIAVSQPNEPLHTVYTPVFCVIVQGSKEVFLGNERYEYNPSHYLIVTTKLPVITHVFEASAVRPYLSLRLDLDPTLISSVMIEAGDMPSNNGGSVRAINASALNADLLERLGACRTCQARRITERRSDP